MILLLLLVTLVIGEHWSVELPSEVDPHVFALEHQVKYVKTVFGYSVFESDHRTNNLFFATKGLHKDVKRRQKKRYASRYSDPLFPRQWHLHTLGIDGVNETGRGVTIAIVDDGLEVRHPDLSSNVQLDLSYDYNHHKADPTPSHRDGHGTSAAGVCCAARNNICGRGVAPEAKIAGIKLISEPAYDFEEAQALTHKSESIRIYSNSWGPEDCGCRTSGPGQVTKAALRRTAGKVIYVWAAGNGRSSRDNVNYDGYANSPYTLAIGAVNHNGDQSWYSESGACLLAVAPSSGAGKSITTTDLTGSYGYSRGECTGRFGGTSSAAPLAAGIFALMLQVNPNLTYRDIMHIVAKTSPDGHTHEKGFGVLQIPPLIEATRTHVLVPALRIVKTPIIRIRVPVPDDGTWFEQHISYEHSLQFIEQIAVTVDMMHDCHGQVHIQLNDSILAESRGDCTSGSRVWTYTTLHEWGKRDRSWVFRIRDDSHDAKRGMLMAVSLKIYGY